MPEKETSLTSSDDDRNLDRPLPIEKAWMPSEEWHDEREYTRECSRDIADVSEPLVLDIFVATIFNYYLIDLLFRNQM